MSFLSRFTRKAANTSRMETIAKHALFASESDALNARYQTLYKTHIVHKSPQIQTLMENINAGVRMLNKLVQKPSLNKDLDKPRIDEIIHSMKLKLDLAIPMSERGKKYEDLQSLIYSFKTHYLSMVIQKRQPYTPRNYEVIQELQRNMRNYNSSTFRNTSVGLNKRATTASVREAAATQSYNAASAKFNKRLEGVNVAANIMQSKMNATTGMYNGPTAGDPTNAEVEAMMRNAFNASFPKVPSAKGGRRRVTRRRRA